MPAIARERDGYDQGRRRQRAEGAGDRPRRARRAARRDEGGVDVRERPQHEVPGRRDPRSAAPASAPRRGRSQARPLTPRIGAAGLDRLRRPNVRPCRESRGRGPSARVRARDSVEFARRPFSARAERANDAGARPSSSRPTTRRGPGARRSRRDRHSRAGHRATVRDTKARVVGAADTATSSATRRALSSGSSSASSPCGTAAPSPGCAAIRGRRLPRSLRPPAAAARSAAADPARRRRSTAPTRATARVRWR